MIFAFWSHNNGEKRSLLNVMITLQHEFKMVLEQGGYYYAACALLDTVVYSSLSIASLF